MFCCRVFVWLVKTCWASRELELAFHAIPIPTREMIASAAVQEDVDVVGLSILSGAHMTLFPRVRDLLRNAGRDDVLVTGGGIIPKEDMDELRRQGIGQLFGPGTPTSELADYIKKWFAERQQQEA